MQCRTTVLMYVVVLTALNAQATWAQTPLGTEFTFQGQLQAAGGSGVSTADFQCALFDSLNGGTQIGATEVKNNVALSNGNFTLTLEFGGSALNGDARFLQVSVRSPAGAGAFNTLSPRQVLSGTPYALQTRGIVVDSAGKVGIGTSSPLTKLDVRGGAMSVEHVGDQADLLSLNSERSWVFRQQGTGAATALKLQSVGGGGNKNFIIDTDGAVGINTNAPAAALHISQEVPVLILQDSGSTSTQVGYVTFWNSNPTETGWVGYGTQGSPHLSVVNARPGGNIVLETAPGGVVSVPVLEIRGADVAEKFPASEKLAPGMVVAIDKTNPGKLCLARGAYNRCVAGVVSGANNFSVGAVLGSAPELKDAPPIALSGRVYVHCDASSGSIEPGNLLTTSETPGHAMKAIDANRSHGAVIGKAMTELKTGRGLVLMLVQPH